MIRTARLALFSISCVAVMAIVALSAFASSPSRQNAVFKNITARNIGDVHTRINGSATSWNKIPAGTVLTYRTNSGNFGKLQILKYGYNLRVRWVTYKPEGTVLSRGNNLLIRGTYTYDLDRGVQASGLEAPADLFWEQATNTLRYLVATNGASFTVASYKPCELSAPRGPGAVPCQ